MSTLRRLGECEVIRRLARLVGTSDDIVVGIGDDAAVVRLEGLRDDLLLTSDAVIEGTHFLPTARAERVGHKAVGRVLSDFAAVGGEPLWALVDLVAPPSISWNRLEKAYRGAAKLAAKYGLAIVGGDTAQGSRFELHVFGVGRVPRGAAVLRSGAQVGDIIYVTGALGGSLQGRHLDFEPRVEEGLWLREAPWARAMIDVSDGLARDLGHIVEESRVGAELDAEAIPISPQARKFGGAALPHALFDGEDFELLFTVAPEKRAAFESCWRETFRLPCTAIGRIVRRKGLWLRKAGRMTRLPLGGFEHFRADARFRSR
jgi:thiamine-monophosphate kinase